MKKTDKQKLKIAINFIEELTDATGRFTYLNDTGVVSEARKILKIINPENHK